MRRLLTTLMLAAILTSFVVQPAAARDKASFEKLSGDILETLQEFYPVKSTGMGIHDYDDRLTDYSSGSVKRMRDRLTEYTKKLYKYRNFNFTLDDGIDYKLIRANVEMALLEIREVKLHTRAPQIYVDDAIDGIYYLMLSQHAPMSAKLNSILARMRAVPDLFASARRNLRKPPPVWIDLAVERLDAGQQFYQQVGGELMNRFPDRADEILRVVTQAREAMADLTMFLSEIPAGDPTAFALGRKNFDYILSHSYFLDYDADSLLRIGENLLAQTDTALREYRAYVEENHQNGRDSIFVPASFNRQDVLDYYQWEVKQTRLFFADNNILTVPEDIAPIEVVETPSFLRSMIGGIAYQPAGPFDSVQKGLFYVRPLPEQMDAARLAGQYRYVYRRGFKGSVVHEAYPGHHLQLQLAARHPSAVRKWQTNPLLMEGWALYSEEMAYRAGLYGDEDPAMWLAILGGIRFRAARIVADVKLHTGQFTYQECVDWMCEVLEAETESARQYHRTMVRKYTTQPAYYMSYLVGKIELQKILDDYRGKMGESFNEKEFYDRLLSQGAIPPALIREALGL